MQDKGLTYDRERLAKQFAFIREIDKEKQIFRQTYISDATRKENDAEHAWHMAIMVFLLSEYANEEIDILKTIRMLLIHDIVEIDAGDTYAYDEAAKATQHEREQAAAKRIFGILPKDQGEALLALWEEFEAGESKEARFARGMDNIQPMMLNDATDGKAWVEHEVVLSKVLKRNRPTPKGSEILWDYARENLIKKNVENGKIINDIAENF
uniref:HD domain-containing protein n=1 Tax=Agathobacter sp. TaxID=2021311 RepID=UPI004055F78A